MNNQILNQLHARARAMLSTWPGLFTLASLVALLLVGMIIISRSSNEASAQASSASTLAQIATRTATRTPARAVINALTATKVATATRQPPTHTPSPTTTQIADSPLTHESTTPPQAAFVGIVISSQNISGTETEQGTEIITTDKTQMVSATATADVLLFLVPTPTPTPTRTITEALEQPIGPGGMAAIAATATAIAPIAAQSTAELPPVTEAQAAQLGPTATAAIQPTPDGNVRIAQVPILMYHYLSNPPADADIYRQDLSVSPDLFAAQLDAILQAGYTPISLYALLDHLTLGTPLPEKPVVFTFDDGYRDNYTNAFPLLRDRGVTATFFIVTDFIYDERPEYLTWDMVREMYAAGMSIEAHGRNHVSLANKDDDYLIWQALGNYESIEVEIGVRPRFIAYPAGEYDQSTINIFRSANYWAGFTTKQGAIHRNDDLFQMRRVRVRGGTSPEELLRLLALDW